MFSRVSAQGKTLNEKVQRATAAHLTEPRFDLNQELANHAVSDKKAAYWIVKHLRHRLWDPEPACAINAIYVFITLMSTSNENVYYQMNRKGIQEFAKLYREKIHQSRGVAISEQNRLLLRLTLTCVEDWYRQVKSVKDCGEFAIVYKDMLSKGVTFPSHFKKSSQNRANARAAVSPPISHPPPAAALPPVLQRPPSSTGIQYRICVPTPFYSHPNRGAVVGGIQGPQPGVILDAVFEDNGWVLLEVGMYVPVVDPNTGALCAEALPYQAPPPRVSENPPSEDKQEVKDEGNYGDNWLKTKFDSEMKRIINVVELCQSMLIESSTRETAADMVMNEALQLTVVDLAQITEQLQQMMETMTNALVLEYIFSIKANVDDTLKLHETLISGGKMQGNANIDKDSLLQRLVEVNSEINKPEKSDEGEGEQSHDEMDSNSSDDPFGLKKLPETKGNDDFNLNVDPFANTSTEDPFSATNPFSSSEKPPDPFASKQTPNMVDDLLSAAFAPTQTSEPPADIFGFTKPSEDPFKIDPFMQPAATEKPLGPFGVSLKDPEPGTPEANANIESIIPPKTEEKKGVTLDFFSKTGVSSPMYDDPFASVIGENSEEPDEDVPPGIAAANPNGFVAPVNSSSMFGAQNPSPGFGASNPNPAFASQNPSPGFGLHNPTFVVQNASPGFGPHNSNPAFGPPMTSNPNPTFGPPMTSNLNPAFGAPTNPDPAFTANIFAQPNPIPNFGAPAADPFAQPPQNSIQQPGGNPFSDATHPTPNPFASSNSDPFASPVATSNQATTNPFQSPDKKAEPKPDPFASLGDPFADFGISKGKNATSTEI